MSNKLGIKVGDFVRVEPSQYSWSDYVSHYIFEVVKVYPNGVDVRITHDKNFSSTIGYWFTNNEIITHYPVKEYVRVTDGGYVWDNYNPNTWYPVVYDYAMNGVTIHINDDLRFDPYSTFTFFEEEILERKEA